MGEALRNGTATPDDVEGALARSKAVDIDPATLRNVLRVSSDDGPHAEAIEAIVRRIPNGWARWLSVDAGWYSLVIATHARLAQRDLGYVVHQIKEKYETLRYYYYWPGSDDLAPDLSTRWMPSSGAERVSAITCERCGQSGHYTEPSITG
ncbi:hypothetical protein FK535_02715 [Mycolicibacterium sp. 018/SC-01/001]|uniref:hypothetical protein n=1 Tax=Mycolicibacterium sp. 018/SC-01/001 TaxID=2592069 RepID=UPI00117F9A65|nr:hypothetical protein [Mycolicibacterium sp. 018/SC-01/001]TRW89179.1 hypothetical protein FK535_02715 [Mycolicibacterium sp. 018/SC-01/001]